MSLQKLRRRACFRKGRGIPNNTCEGRDRFVDCEAFAVAPIAQLDRASDYGSEGYRFNSYWVRQLVLSLSICNGSLLFAGGVSHK